jgi:diguanylate cyclase (GGDEF)-like protein
METARLSTTEKISKPDVSAFRQVQMTLRNYGKRIFDFFAALFGLIILSPFFAWIAFRIKRDSPGPVFYWGERTGRYNRTFRMLKFRTMHECPESYNGPRVTCQDDDRITPLGHWLRDTKINELPQLWNVLLGEMSLVGPRPEDPEISKSWPSAASREILSVRPGVTSPASILYHDEEKLLSSSNLMGEYFRNILPDKLRLDQLYVRHRSFFSDLDIIFWTMAIMIPRLAQARIPEGYIFAGPFSRVFHRYISWFVLDLVTAFAVTWVVGLLWGIQGPPDWGAGYIVFLAASLAILFSGVNSMAGLNRIVWSHATFEDGISLLFSGAFTTLVVFVFNFLQTKFPILPFSPLPLPMIITIGVMSLVGFVILRYRLRLLTSVASRWLTLRQDVVRVGERVLIVGNGEGGQIAQWLLGRRMFRTAFSIVGIVDDINPTRHGMRVNGCWMLGGTNDLPDLVEKFDVGIIVSTLSDVAPEIDEFIFNICQATKIRHIQLKDLLWIVDQQVTRPVGSFEYPEWLDDRLEFRAMHDTVTELPNQGILRDRLKHALAYARRYHTKQSVMFIELTGLRAIDDLLGRQVADDVLKEVAHRLELSKRESDTLARFEEDSFTLIMENVPNEKEARLIAYRILDSVSLPVVIKGRQLSVDPKVGVSLCTGNCDVSQKMEKIDMRVCYRCAMSQRFIKASV